MGHPPIDKPVTVELGNVSPIIVVPGKWSDQDLDHHAEIVAAALVHNSGHCSTGAEVRSCFDRILSRFVCAFIQRSFLLLFFIRLFRARWFCFSLSIGAGD